MHPLLRDGAPAHPVDQLAARAHVPLQRLSAARAALFPAAAIPWLIAFLMLAYTAGYAWSTPHTDTADELLRAYEIRHALAFPLEGPFLGGALHLGPIWFYLVALPLWISHSWLAAALFIGLVCGLKFPLAYWCGRALVDRDFGVLWAASMFVPGWSSFEQLMFLNPNAVAAATLLVLAVALRIVERRAGPWMFVALGLALGLAIHVHPTSMPIFLLVAPVLWAQHRRGLALGGAVLAIGAGLLLLFVPYALHEVRSGFADWSSASAYLSGQVIAANAVHAVSVIVNNVTSGPAVSAQYLMGWSPAHANGLAIAFTVAVLLSFSGLAYSVSRRLLLHFAGALVTFAAWIACARPTTPLQFAWVLAPILAGLVAIGLWSLGKTQRLRPVVWLLVAAGIAVNIDAIAAIARTVDGGDGVLPSRILDVQGRLPPVLFRDVWFPAVGHAELGRVLCSTRTSVSLHGQLAYVVDRDLGLDALFECQDRSRIALLGSAGSLHYFGMTRPFWAAFDGVPECWVGSLGLTRHVTPLLHREPLAIADGSTYLPRPATHDAPRHTTFDVAAPRDAGVMLTNVVGEYERFAVVSAAVDGLSVAPLAQTDHSSLYAARGVMATPGTVHWTFSVASTNLAALDVVAIERRAMPGAEQTPEAGSDRSSAACGGRF